jgi:hypothetical protein
MHRTEVLKSEEAISFRRTGRRKLVKRFMWSIYTLQRQTHQNYLK